MPNRRRRALTKWAWQEYVVQRVQRSVAEGHPIPAMRLAAENNAALLWWLLEEHELNSNMRLADDGSDAFSYPLILAADTGSAASVAMLLKFGAEVDARDWQDTTALHRAASQGYLDVVKLLLADGASTNAPEGQLSPVELARANGHDEVVAFLEGR